MDHACGRGLARRLQTDHIDLYLSWARLPPHRYRRNPQGPHRPRAGRQDPRLRCIEGARLADRRGSAVSRPARSWPFPQRTTALLNPDPGDRVRPAPDRHPPRTRCSATAHWLAADSRASTTRAKRSADPARQPDRRTRRATTPATRPTPPNSPPQTPSARSPTKPGSPSFRWPPHSSSDTLASPRPSSVPAPWTIWTATWPPTGSS